MSTLKKWTIWPLLYFEADWSEPIYNFDLGIKLLKAEETDLDAILDTTAFYQNPPFISELYNNTKWFFAIHTPEAIEHISVDKMGMSFRRSVETAIMKSFLLCMQLVRSTAALCPSPFESDDCKGPLNLAELIVAEKDTDFYCEHSEQPMVHNPQTYQIEDLVPILNLWSAMINLRQLDRWSSGVFKEEFFADLDRKATEETEAFDKIWRQNPELMNKISEQLWTKETREDYYKIQFQKAFTKKEEETFSSRTRIGRALTLFGEGIKLPKLHAFLSMCLVLETLFTVDKGEVVHKLVTRFAKIVGGSDSEQRKDFYKRVKTVYTERSNIVHGSKLLEAVKPEVWSDAFSLARLALRKIMLDNQIINLYSAPETSDIKSKKKKSGQKESKNYSLEDYFLDLDLDTRVNL